MRTGRCGLLRVAVLAVLLAGAPAIAQEKLSFDIPEQTASLAIQSWAQQSGLQVFAAEEHLRGVRTNPVRGDYTPIEAVQMLIAGTGLEVVAAGDKTVTIRKPSSGDSSAVPADSPAATHSLLELDEVIVTGSRIKRPGFDTLQAALVTDANEISQRAYTNLGEALEATPGFLPSDSSPSSTAQGTHSVGQTFVNFFGLGSQRTLTLVNGRRFVSSNSATGSRGGVAPGSQVDLNVIPVGLIDHVETVSIGGAPVYGSDAIAGTVNIILKDDFEGIQGSAQYGLTEDGDGEGTTFRLLMGGNFGEDRGNAVVSLEHNEQDGLLLSDRFRFRQLAANPLDTGDGDGISARRVVEEFRFPIATEGGLPYSNLAGVGLPGLVFPGLHDNGDYIFDAQGTPLQFGRNGDLAPFNLGTVVFDDVGIPGITLPQQSSGGDGLNLSRHIPILSPTQRTLVNGMAHYDVAPWARLFVETSYAHTEAQEESEFYSFTPALTFSTNNAFLSQQARDTIVASLGGGTSFAMSRNLNDITDRQPGQTQLDLYRIVGGFEGDIGDQLSWNVSYNYGRSRNDSELTVIDPTRLANALDAIVDTGGNIVCASAATNPDCAALNLFGENNFSDAAADYITDTGHAISLNTQTILNANLSGRLPFGIAEPIAFNIGVERRDEDASFKPDATQEAGILLANGSNAFRGIEGGITTKEAYTELVVPLITPVQDFSLIRSMSVEGAVRYVDHSLAGEDTTWSAGGRFSPNLGGWSEGLVVRGVFTHAIRSPAVTELFLGTVPGSFGISDPCDALNFDQGLNPSVRAANCATALAAVGASAPETFNSTTGVFSAFGTVSGNPNLENETADSWSVGFSYQPTALPGFRLAIDWSDISIEGGIDSLGIGQLLGACYDSANFPNEPACGAFRRLTPAEAAAQPSAPRVAGDVADGFRTGYVNTASIEFSGLIADAQYSFDLRQTPMYVGLTLFYADRLESLTFPGAQLANTAGTLGLPRLRANFNIGYSWGRLDTDLQAQWRSSTVVSKLDTFEDTPVNNVDAYTLLNATLGYRITDTLRAQLAVRNLLDEEVPFEAQVGGSYTSFDAIGRRYFLTVTASFE